MNSAMFLLVINFFIGLSFAAAFVGLSWKLYLPLSRWCAAGFLCASGTVSVEALASVLPSVRLTSTLSFGSLMAALTLITIGLARHYRPQARMAPLIQFAILATAFNSLVVFDWPRGGWPQSLGYQTPFAIMLAVASYIVGRWSRRRPSDLVLAVVLGLASAHYLIKAALAALSGGGPGVRAYISSSFSFYAQTAGGILSLLLGLSLVALIFREVMALSRAQFERDGLSGVFNRSAFLDRMSQAGRAGRPAALVIADLDHFKSINDRFGHAAGDEVIRRFGALLNAVFPEPAICGRLGGEEFCLLLPDCAPADVRTRLESFRAALLQQRYAQIPPDIVVTSSFGVAVVADDEPFDQALHRADLALYEAKGAGRDAYRFARAVGGSRSDQDGPPPFRIKPRPN